MLVLGIFVLLFGIVFGSDEVVLIKQGLIKGSNLKSRDGRYFKAFQGIPYAKPPVGDLRFKDPVPGDSWKGVFEATTESYMCIQKNVFVYIGLNTIMGDEDCLYLNVYTPKIPKKEDKLLPVMVWIPGGGFSSGTGGLKLNGPHYLLDKDIVVVSFNYRLGILGFLSTEDEALSGNLGMKDQVLALRWVKDNIEKFGGDPKRVTLVGESAGSVSVSLHLLSPMSKGLFHKAIMESGTALVPWGVTPPGLARRRAMAVSTLTGCPQNTKEMVECLREVPARVLVDIYTNFFEWRNYPMITFTPVVENCDNASTTESFLCRYPTLDFKQESKVPVIIGMNSGEGGIFASRMHGLTGMVYHELNDNFGYYLSTLIQYKYTTKQSDLQAIGEKVFERYYPDGSMSDPLKSVKMISGGLFFHGIIKMALQLSQPVYYYIYDHANLITCNMGYGPYPLPKKLGVSHADEIISLFHTIGEPGLMGEDYKVSKLMVDLWTSFIISNGNLTIDGKDGSENWPTFDSTSYKFLMINSSKPVIDEKPHIDEYEFWNNLPLLSAFKKPEKVIKTEL